MITKNLQALIAELFGTLLLALIVVGSGLQGPALGADPALGLVINILATSVGLWVLITLFGPISGAHFNPVVTLLMLWRRSISAPKAIWYLVAQLLGALIGVGLANLMYLESAFSWSDKLRANPGTALAELVATVGLLLVVVLLGPRGLQSAAVGVATWIGAAAFATSSTAFANPALSLARIFAADGSGIEAASAWVFVAVELMAIPLALGLIKVFQNQTEGERK